MPPAIHEILAHGAQIILNCAAESQNKYRHDRLHYAQKTSRIDNLTDIFKCVLVSLDIIISTINLSNRINTRKRKFFPSEVADLLIINNIDDLDIEMKNDLDQSVASEECNFELESGISFGLF